MALSEEEPPDSLMQTLIEVVRDNTEKTMEVRSDVNRSMLLIYQRIIAVESQNMIEAKERPARQIQLDRTLEKINKRLDGQDKILEGQDKKLDTLFDDGRWRFWLMVGILIVCLFVAVRVALLWFS